MKVGGHILWNVIPICETSQMPYERRFGQPFKGPIIPCGSLVEYHTITAKDQSRIHQFWKTVLLVGYSLYPGGIWKGDAPVADFLRSWKRWSSEIYSNRFNAKEVTFPKEKGEFIFFESQMDESTPWRRSRPENIHLHTASTNSRKKYYWLSWRIRRVSSTTSRLTSGCRWSDWWFLVHVRKLQIPPSRWTQSQTLLAERRIIPFSTEIHWRLQNYKNELGGYARKPHRWLLEHRWIKRFVWFLDRFHSVYSWRWETTRRGYVVRGETSRPEHLWPELWIK